MAKVTMVQFGKVVAEVFTWPKGDRAKLSQIMLEWQTEEPPKAPKTRRALKEGVVKKGGQNSPPTSPRPAPPQGQGTS
jgi:hypothetical protein